MIVAFILVLLLKPRVNPKINGNSIKAIQQIALNIIAQQTADPDAHVNNEKHEKHEQLVQHAKVVQHDIGSHDLWKCENFKKCVKVKKKFFFIKNYPLRNLFLYNIFKNFKLLTLDEKMFLLIFNLDSFEKHL